MKKLQNSAALIFIVCAFVLTVVSILGVWDVFGEEVVSKSFQTLGLLAFVAIVIIFAGRFIDHKSEVPGAEDPTLPVMNPTFTSIRHITVAALVAVSSLLALVGVLSIWEVIAGEVVSKSVSSLGILIFSSLIIVLTCLERENHKLLRRRFSGGFVFLTVVFLWILWLAF